VPPLTVAVKLTICPTVGLVGLKLKSKVTLEGGGGPLVVVVVEVRVVVVAVLVLVLVAVVKKSVTSVAKAAFSRGVAIPQLSSMVLRSLNSSMLLEEVNPGLTTEPKATSGDGSYSSHQSLRRVRSAVLVKREDASKLPGAGLATVPVPTRKSWM